MNSLRNESNIEGYPMHVYHLRHILDINSLVSLLFSLLLQRRKIWPLSYCIY